MQISVHYWTPTENHSVTSTMIGETHTHMETLCLIGRGLVASVVGSLPEHYSIWVDGRCAQAIGSHGPFINMVESDVPWDEPLIK